MSLRRIVLVALAVVIATALSACALLPFGGDDAAAPPPPPPPGTETADAGADTTATDGATTTDAAGGTETADATSGEVAVEEPPAIEVTAAEEDSGPVEPQALFGADAKVFADGAYLVNVDKYANYRIEHIDGAANVPLGDLADASAGWDEDGAIMVTGRKTGLARSGAQYLSRQGFTNVAYLDGGHGAWTGWYDGVAEREPETRAKVYYIYSGDPRAWPTEDDAEAALSYWEHGVEAATAEDYRALDRRFSQDIDFELVDATSSSSQLQRALTLFDQYDVDRVDIGEGEMRYLIPQWILVDKNGRVTQLWDTPDWRGTLARVYGWMVQESMRLTSPTHDQRNDFAYTADEDLDYPLRPVRGAHFIWLDQTPWVRPDL